jgi:P-type conjugative transfer protein TrbG
MDTRRFLTLTCAGLLLSGCAVFKDLRSSRAVAKPAAQAAAPVVHPAVIRTRYATMAPIPNPPERVASSRRVASASRGVASPQARARRGTVSGRTAIAAANLQAREPSRSEAFVGGVQVFSYDPGRVYEVWTAPLRVTTLTLAPGESIVSKAAGDTVRWQIGETTSGQGPAARSHVMIKPMARGLETNLVLATSQRVYLIQLKSGPPETFNAAVAWDLAAVTPSAGDAYADVAETPPGLVTPAGPLDARYKISARGRRPDWAPTAVMTDGSRTFLRFPPELSAGEAPALFVVGPGGSAQLVNYRQHGGLWVVDRVFDRAELRIGDRRSQVVRIERKGDRS